MGQGLWQFTVMPFGLSNAPATIKRLMETVLRGLTCDSCLVYLDGVIVIGRTFREHLLNLRKLFQLFCEARQLFRKEVQYLGHIVSLKGRITDPEKLKAIWEWPPPKNKHEIRRFLGICRYDRLFISGLRMKDLLKLNRDQLRRVVGLFTGNCC
jgi:hypothetical protein